MIERLRSWFDRSDDSDESEEKDPELMLRAFLEHTDGRPQTKDGVCAYVDIFIRASREQGYDHDLIILPSYMRDVFDEEKHCAESEDGDRLDLAFSDEMEHPALVDMAWLAETTESRPEDLSQSSA